MLGEGADFLLDELVQLPAAIEHYSKRLATARDGYDPDMYYRLAQTVAILKKLEYPLFEEAARELSFKKWLDAEAACKETNRRCWDINQHPLTTEHTELQNIIDAVRREIGDVLPEVPPDYDQLVGWMKFGPGASLSHPAGRSSLPQKLSTFSAYKGMEEEVGWLTRHTMLSEPLLLSNLEGGFGDENVVSPKVEYFEEARLETVPKSVSEMRWIEIGPSLATFFQQGFDGFIRRRLKDKWGLDLRDQAPNQRLARLGSLSGIKPNSPCTIDLSSASDRIAFGLVASVLPVAWVRALLPFRARYVRGIDGESISLEKFSSMGNAYTFSLQTLIFSAVVRAILRTRGWEGSRWRVYGDDIIVPYRIYNETVAWLEQLGFQVNKEKSFNNDSFRESCGADFLNGTNVRPLYLKKPIVYVTDLYKVLNLVQAQSQRSPIPARTYEDLYRLLLSWVPPKFFLVGNMQCDVDSCVRSPTIIGRRTIIRWQIPDVKVSPRMGYFSALYNGYKRFEPIDLGSCADYSSEKIGRSFPVFRKTPQGVRSTQRAPSVELDPLLMRS